jgi:hypothetical protein
MYGQDWTPLAAPGLARMRSPWEQGTTVSKMGDYIQVLPVETRAPLPSELGARMRPTLERSSATHGAHQESLRSKWSQNSRAGRSRSPRKPSQQQLLKSEDPTLQRSGPHPCRCQSSARTLVAEFIHCRDGGYAGGLRSLSHTRSIRSCRQSPSRT